jgi:hypothetical protein
MIEDMSVLKFREKTQNDYCGPPREVDKVSSGTNGHEMQVKLERDGTQRRDELPPPHRPRTCSTKGSEYKIILHRAFGNCFAAMTAHERGTLLLSLLTPLVAGALIHAMGHPLICKCGFFKFWHSDLSDAEVSQHLVERRGACSRLPPRAMQNAP